MKNQLEAIVTSLKNILKTCRITSALIIPIWTFEQALGYDGHLRDMTIRDARRELLECVHDEEDNDNPDVAARLRDVLRI